MIVTTMNDIPGYEVDEVYGEVMGLTVRSRNIGSQIGASLKSILGGELKGMTKALMDSREQVMQRMIDEAELKGGSARRRAPLRAVARGAVRPARRACPSVPRRSPPDRWGRAPRPPSRRGPR